MVQGETHVETNNLKQDPTMYGQIYGSMSDAAKNKAKQKWGVEKPKLDNARQLHGIFLSSLNQMMNNSNTP